MKRLLFLAALMVTVAAQGQNIFRQTHFSLIYPSDWDTTHVQGIAVVLSPAEGENDPFRENMNILVEPYENTKNMELDEYYITTMDVLKSNMEVDDSFFKVSDYKVGKNEDAGKLIQYDTDVHTTPLGVIRYWQILVKSGRKFYVITYSSQPDKFAKYLPKIEDMVKNLRLN